ncbi:MAG: oxidase [Phycisphaerales bacterium]|nr:oxidase [Phycisphaerales bacterium]
MSTPHTTTGHATSAQPAAHDDHPLVGHLVPVSTLIATASALLVLTFITVAVRYIDIGEFNVWVAIGIAVVKAALVASFFMHLRWDRPFNLLVFVGCTVFVVLMMAFCVLDTSQYRATQYTGNPPLAQETLDANAPAAPVARFKPGMNP